MPAFASAASRPDASPPAGRLRGPRGGLTVRRSIFLTALGLAALAGVAGCALVPDGTDEERANLRAAGALYDQPLEQRTLPDLPASPTWQEVLRRAFLANGDLEASYFEWKAAVQRVEIASAYPNSNLEFGYSYMFSAEKMKAFDRQTFSLGFDPSMNFLIPTKVRQQGRVALDDARAAGERFRAAKFDTQRRVLSLWAELRMLESRRQVQHEQVRLNRLSIDAVRARAQAGGVQRDLLRAEASLRTQENGLRNTESELSATRAILNGLLVRDPAVAIDTTGDSARTIAATDDQILAAAVELNPEIAAIARQTEGRADALELARMQWIPDINPSFMFTGNVSQALGATVMLPTTIARIRGGIREAEAMLRAGEAMLRQTRTDRAATLVATLVALRNNERQAALFEGSLVPLAERVLQNTRQAYAAGTAMYIDLLDAQGIVLDTRLVAIEARSARDKRLAELESLMGTDIEAVGASPVPASSPIHQMTPDPKEAPHGR